MATAPTGKYYLRSIHEEIALFDRKLAHLEKYETFTSDGERELAARKMVTKRKALVTIAQRLVAEGVEFAPAELPRSLRPAGSEEVPPAAVAVQTEESGGDASDSSAEWLPLCRHVARLAGERRALSRQEEEQVRQQTVTAARSRE
jgi:hypothetical protein